MEFIKLKGVTQEFKKNKILDDVTFTIEAGDIVGVIGQSGSGKTTLLNLIAGFIEPTEGEIVFCTKVGGEKNLHKNLHKIKHHIGFTPQHNSFYPMLTVEENLLHFGKLYRLDNTQLKNNIQNLLNFTRLIDHKDKPAANLSGGMQKRLDISCSLVHKPKLLILDEPTADLDPILQKEILHLIQEVNRQGVTTLIASHQLDSIDWLCNKVAIVHQGKVRVQGLLDELKDNFANENHFTIKVPSGRKKEKLIERLQTLPIKKIIDKGKTLVIYPENVDETVRGLVSIVKEEGLNLINLDLKSPHLNEIFENVVLGEQ